MCNVPAELPNLTKRDHSFLSNPESVEKSYHHGTCPGQYVYHLTLCKFNTFKKQDVKLPMRFRFIILSVSGDKFVNPKVAIFTKIVAQIPAFFGLVVKMMRFSNIISYHYHKPIVTSLVMHCFLKLCKSSVV